MAETIFSILTLLSLAGLIIGLIKPSKVIRWGEKKTRKQVALVYGMATLIFFILFAVTVPPPDKTSLTEKKEETKSEIIQLVQEESSPKEQTETPQEKSQPIALLNSEGTIIPIISGVSPKELDQKQIEFIYKGDIEGLTNLYEKYLLDIPNNTKALILGEEMTLEPNLDLGRKQVEHFVKIKILEGSYKDTVGWVNRSDIKIISQ